VSISYAQLFITRCNNTIPLKVHLHSYHTIYCWQ